jgi:DNA-binding NarL/FixJ family response regulator
MIRAILQRSTSRAFQRSFVIMLVAETITILVAWLLLDYNVKSWLHSKTAALTRISQETASAADWSMVDKLPMGRDSSLADAYQDRLYKLSNQHFLGKEGSVYLAIVERGEEYDIYSGDQTPGQDAGKANQWVLNAYGTRRTTYSPVPIVDDTGTYLAAYTPILRDGKVIGLVAAEYDEAPLSNFQSVVRSAFWFSLLPAIVIALVVANVLSSMFVEPIDVLRTIEETAQSQQARSQVEEENDPWHLLTTQEKQIAELLRQGRESAKDIAEALSVQTGSVYTYFKRIKVKTGWSKQGLALQAAARRSASADPRT